MAAGMRVAVLLPCLHATLTLGVRPDDVLWAPPVMYEPPRALRSAAYVHFPGTQSFAHTVVHHVCPRLRLWSVDFDRRLSWAELARLGVCERSRLNRRAPSNMAKGLTFDDERALMDAGEDRSQLVLLFAHPATRVARVLELMQKHPLPPSWQLPSKKVERNVRSRASNMSKALRTRWLDGCFAKMLSGHACHAPLPLGPTPAARGAQLPCGAGPAGGAARDLAMPSAACLASRAVQLLAPPAARAPGAHALGEPTRGAAPREAPTAGGGRAEPAARVFVGLEHLWAQSVCLFHAAHGGPVHRAELERAPPGWEKWAGRPASSLLSKLEQARLPPNLAGLLSGADAAEVAARLARPGLELPLGTVDALVYVMAKRAFARAWRASRAPIDGCVRALRDAHAHDIANGTAAWRGTGRTCPAVTTPARAADGVNGEEAGTAASPCAAGDGGACSARLRFPRALAVGFHGHYDRLGRGLALTELSTGPIRFCSDYWRVAPGVRARVLDAARAAGARVRVYLHSYASGCSPKDRALLRALRPARYELSAQLLPRVADSYLRVLGMMLGDDGSGEDEPEYGAQPSARDAPSSPPFAASGFVLLRFDTVLHAPLHKLPILWGALSLAFRDKRWAWRTECRASDLFFAGAMAHAPALVTAINVTASVGSTKEERARRRGSLHTVYVPLAALLGDGAVRFVDEGRTGSSSLHVGSGRNEHLSFIAIDRRCEGIDLDRRIAARAAQLGARAAGGGEAGQHPPRAAEGNGTLCWRGERFANAAPKPTEHGLALERAAAAETRPELAMAFAAFG